MTATSKHTPLPWTVQTIWGQQCGVGYSIKEQRGNEDTEEAIANAKLIAHACRMHTKIVNCLQIIVEDYEGPKAGAMSLLEFTDWLMGARDILAEALGEKLCS